MVRHTEDSHRLRYPQGMGRPTKSVLLFSVVLAASPACKRQTSPGADVDLAGMDTSVAPGDDFNAYANGGWIKATPIPADKSSYGIGAILVDETRQRTLSLIQEAAKDTKPAIGDVRKIGDYFSSFMDEAAIESKGITPLQPQLDAFAAIADRHMLARALGGELRADVDALNSTNFETGNLLAFGLRRA